MTANAVVGAKEEFLSASFDDYLTKPIVPEKLDRIILLHPILLEEIAKHKPRLLKVFPEVEEKLPIDNEDLVRGCFDMLESAMLNDDFNTADAISAVFELVKYANTTASGESSKEYLESVLGLIVKLTDVLGLIVEKEEEMLAEEIETLIEERQAARKAKNFQRADEIRNELLEKGIILEDTREGVKWRRA